MNSQQPGLYPGQPLSMQQAMNQAGASRQQQQQPLLWGSPNLPTALSDGPSWATIPTMSQPSISNTNSMLGPGGPTGNNSTDMHSGAHRRPQPQQFMSQNQMLYQEQHIAMYRQLQQQQKQQQQTHMQTSSATQQSGMPWSQLNSIQQQPAGQVGSFQYQAFMRKQQKQPQTTMQNPTVTNNMTDLQLQWLQMQHNQMQHSHMQQNQMQLNQLQSNLIQQNQILLDPQQNQILGSGGADNMNNMRGQFLTQRQAGLQQQLVPGQQHLLSPLQLQQQQVPWQQQPNMMQQREMQVPQQRMQGSPALLPMQNSNANVIDQQRHQQQQSVEFYDIDSSCSTTHIGHPGDWEEMYQKLKYLKDAYFVDLREIHQKVSLKLSQLDIAPPNAGGVEQINKMRQFKIFLEHVMAMLSLGKNNMPVGLKDKLPLYEKQILHIVQKNKKVPRQQPQAGNSSDQPQLPTIQQSQPAMQSQQLPQEQQVKQMDSHLNQLEQQLNTSTMNQYNCLSMPNTMRQDILMNTLQSDQLLTNDTRFRSSQQGAMGPTTSMNPPQMVGSVAAMGSSDVSRGVTMTEIQEMMSYVQVLKQQQQRHQEQIQTQQPMMLTQQQMQQRQSQQRLVQMQQFWQQQLPLQQQVQKQKLQHPRQNQMQQLSQPSEPTDLNSRQGAAGMEHDSMNQQRYTVLGPYNINHQSQLKPGSSLPISNQNIQSSIQRISQGIETERPASLLSAEVTSPKLGTISSPEGTETEGPASLLSAEFTTHEKGTIPSPEGPETERSASLLSDEINSPEEGPIISPQGPKTEKPASLLPVEFTRSEESTILSPQGSETERPALLGEFTSSEVGHTLSIKSPESKRPASPLLEFTSPETRGPPMKKMKRDISVTSNLKTTVSNDSTIQSTATYSTKGLESEMRRTLLEELHEINIRLIDTELTLNEEEANSTAEAGESIFVNCTYKAIALSPNFWTHFTSSHLSPIMPLRLLVPPEYPKCSPVILDKLVDEQRNTDDFLTRARLKFDISINGLSQPMSLKKIAQTWANCARKVIREYAEQFGGGNFSSKIKWKTVNPKDPYIIW